MAAVPLLRPIVALSALVCALLAYAWLLPVRAPLVALASQGLGQTTFAVRLKHLPVGDLLQKAERTLAGNYGYSSQLRFQLAQGQPVRVDEYKLFSGQPPYPLLRANSSDTTAASTTRIELSRTEAGDYVANSSMGRETQRQALSWQHSLTDYLAVERWLAEAAPNQPEDFMSLDFDALTLKRDVWTLLGTEGEGSEKLYEVSKSSPLEATRLFLDARFKPQSFSMAGTFEIERVAPGVLPIAPEPVFHSQTYRVVLDKPIDDHMRLTRLTLRVGGNAKLVEHWENAHIDTGPDTQATLLRATAGRTRAEINGERERYTREELSYPLQSERVQDLLARAVDPLASPQQQAQQLTGFVHNYINYDHHSTMQNVLDVIRNRRGDCNEYAELFTTLSRALGFPSRTVIGLAYSGDDQPAFALHAWNEVLFDGQWLTFDPTWNQINVDATHLPMPNDAAGMLQGITSLNELTFEVLSTAYDGA